MTGRSGSVDFVKLTPRTQAVRTLKSWLQQGLLSAGEILPTEQELAAKLGVSRPTVHAALAELESEGLLKLHERRGSIAKRTLQSWIQQGLLPVGERLPPEQTLAEKLGVSRTALREALAELENEGLLKPHERRGRIVVGTTPSSHSILGNSVAILSAAANPPVAPWQHQQGWSGVVQQGAIEAIGEAGLHALALRPDRFEGDHLRQFLTERPAGVIATRRQANSPAETQALEALRDSGIPVVLFGDLRDSDDFDTVASNHETGSYSLTQWLIGQGRQRILRLWAMWWNAPHRAVWLSQRDAGYERAMREAGLEILPPVEFRGGASLQINWHRDQFELDARLMAGFLWPHLTGDRPVDAILCLSDGVLYAAAAACRLIGRTPGRDVLLAGYDNYWADAPQRQWEPSVPAVTVDKQNRQWGRIMVQLLLERRNDPRAAPMHRTIEPELVVVEESQEHL